MNLIIKVLIVGWIISLQIPSLTAQDTPLSKEYKQEAIERLSSYIEDFYVLPDVGEETVSHLKKKWQEGYFQESETVDSFANALTKVVQEINKDKHMRVMKNRPYSAAPNTPERRIEEQLDRFHRSRSQKGGFAEVRLIEGNVGYLDLRGFAGLERGKPITDQYMGLMSQADAIIIDLRKNGGGSPQMVQYLCSFFFDEKVHLNSLYWRQGDVTTDFYTLEEVGGVRMPDVPLFVLTSDRTFSAAEEFSYNMQTRKRATLVGQTTGGGANPGSTRSLNEDMRVFIPTGMAINPVTKTNWEGVGVIPEVKTEPEETLDKAIALAKTAAEEYRESKNNAYRSDLQDLAEQLYTYKQGSSEKALMASMEKCKDLGLLNEWDINALGYEFLMEVENVDAAEVVFRANTVFYPNSANTFDSYADALQSKDDLPAAIEAREKAVQIAEKTEDGNLDMYKKNLEMLKKKMKE